MRWQAIATDYDGTLACEGRVAGATVEALRACRASGRRLILVTGRQLEDLGTVFGPVELFDGIVAENGALLFRPDTGAVTTLGPPVPLELLAALRARGVSPLAWGRVIVATRQPHLPEVEGVLASLGVSRQIIPNKGALMLLPFGVDKGSGLRALAHDLGVPMGAIVGIGDAENDGAFLAACGQSVAVANALPELRARVHRVTSGADGAGVCEVVERILRDDRAAEV
jgi:hydroxymethylpyrimidine pyrophosphatase-like HAD family hydrolase